MNWRVEDGTVLGLLGKNGAGKSTLLRLISGLLGEDYGRICVDGFRPFSRSREFLDNMFFLPEDTPAGQLTAVQYAHNYGRFYSGFDFDKFLCAAEMLEVDQCRSLARVSFGQRKKAMLSFAFSLGVKHLLLDEPANGLDIQAMVALRSLIRDYASDDRTVIISTHHVADMEGVVDSVSILDKGKILFNGKVRGADVGDKGFATNLESLFCSFTKDTSSEFTLL